MDVTIDDDDRVVDARGDKAHPLTRGYACLKGLQAAYIHNGEDRLLHPLKRMPDGSFQKISLEQALTEISEKVRTILAEDDPRAVCVYRGTQSYMHAPALLAGPAFLNAIGSPSYFTSMTIDQPSKFVVPERMGFWLAGRQPIETCDVWIAAGINPMVSITNMLGFNAFNPVKEMRDLKERGVKLILIDPRQCELAPYADVHLQLYPGEDATLAACLLNIILTEGWHDRQFCADHVDGLDELKQAVASFDVEYASVRCGVPAAAIREAAELFALKSKRGFITTCTGSNMGSRSNLAFHLNEAINVVCGRFRRAGEIITNPPVIKPRQPVRAQAMGPINTYLDGPRSRVGEYHGFTGFVSEMMTNTIVPEIMTPGRGRYRALFVQGGNLANAIPDVKRTENAFGQLDLLVTIDPLMTETARLSHYVLPPKVLYEREDITNYMDGLGFPVPFAQYTPALVPPPAGSELIDDWYPFWRILKDMGMPLIINGVELNMEEAPSTNDILKIVGKDGTVPFEEIATHPSGKIFDVEPAVILPADENAGRFQLAPAAVSEELAEMRAENIRHGAYEEEGKTFTHLLAVRRARETMNSFLRNAPGVTRRVPHNTLHIHSDDLGALGIKDGERVIIESSQGRVEAHVEIDNTIKRGVVNFIHGYGGASDMRGARGANVNELISATKYLQRYTAMPRLTGVPVNILKLIDEPEMA